MTASFVPLQNYRPYSLLESMKLSGCGAAGIKFSTFINDVVVSKVEVDAGEARRGAAQRVLCCSLRALLAPTVTWLMTA